MREICFIASFIFISALAFAQINTKAFKYSNISKAKIIGQASLGTVYAMPLDNMPCLVPTVAKAGLMPKLTTPLQNFYIPNPFTKQDLLIPGFKNKPLLNFYRFKKKESKNLMFDLIQKK